MNPYILREEIVETTLSIYQRKFLPNFRFVAWMGVGSTEHAILDKICGAASMIKKCVDRDLGGSDTDKRFFVSVHPRFLSVRFLIMQRYQLAQA